MKTDLNLVEYVFSLDGTTKDIRDIIKDIQEGTTDQ